jgi:hypothetical protein
VEKAVNAAWNRLRAGGRKMPGRKSPEVFGMEGSRLLAALMVPISKADEFLLARCLDAILGKEEEKEEAFHGD